MLRNLLRVVQLGLQPGTLSPGPSPLGPLPWTLCPGHFLTSPRWFSTSPEITDPLLQQRTSVPLKNRSWGNAQVRLTLRILCGNWHLKRHWMVSDAGISCPPAMLISGVVSPARCPHHPRVKSGKKRVERPLRILPSLKHRPIYLQPMTLNCWAPSSCQELLLQGTALSLNTYSVCLSYLWDEVPAAISKWHLRFIFLPPVTCHEHHSWTYPPTTLVSH